MLTKIKSIKSLAVVFSLTLLFLFAPKVSAIEYGMLGGKPANPDPNVADSSSWFIYNMALGEKKQDSLLVMNLYEKKLDVLVYAADSTKSSGGGFALKQFAETKEEIGSWVKFFPESVPAVFKSVLDAKDEKIVDFCRLSDEEIQAEMKKTKISTEDFALRQTWCQGVDQVKLSLDAKENKKIPFIFSVPDKADVGEHTGGILIQKAEADDTGSEQQGSAVKLTTRVGVRIYETVPGQIIKNLKFSDFKIVKNYKELDFMRWFEKNPKPEDFLVQGKVTNSGNVSIDFQNIINIKDTFFGKRTQEIADRNFQVLKDDTFISNYAWENPRFGRYTFTMGLKYTDDQGKEQVTVSSPITIWIFPWRELIVFVVFAGVFAGAYLARRAYLKKKYGGIGWTKYSVKKTNTIASLAEKFAIDWEVLVRTNKLKPPYLLEAGMIILVPGGKNNEKVVEEIEIVVGKKIIKKAKVAEKVKAPAKTRASQKKEPKAILIAPIKKTNMKKYLCWLGIILLLAGIAVYVVSMVKKKNATKISITTLEVSQEQAQTAPLEMVTEAPVEQTEQAEVKKETGNVAVLNGGALPGTAGKLSDFLKGEGFEQIVTANAELETHQGVVVYYQSEYEPFANKVMDALKTKYKEATLEIAQNDEQKSASIVIVLGK